MVSNVLPFAFKIGGKTCINVVIRAGANHNHLEGFPVSHQQRIDARLSDCTINLGDNPNRITSGHDLITSINPHAVGIVEARGQSLIEQTLLCIGIEIFRTILLICLLLLEQLFAPLKKFVQCSLIFAFFRILSCRRKLLSLLFVQVFFSLEGPEIVIFDETRDQFFCLPGKGFLIFGSNKHRVVSLKPSFSLQMVKNHIWHSRSRYLPAPVFPKIFGVGSAPPNALARAFALVQDLQCSLWDVYRVFGTLFAVLIVQDHASAPAIRVAILITGTVLNVFTIVALVFAVVTIACYVAFQISLESLFVITVGIRAFALGPGALSNRCRWLCLGGGRKWAQAFD
ncbi:hypothetical protein KC356_g104 [Hortaea werneckii]|nr:hypothetical protein KC356_g104 [Hortaea werneckii]